MEVFLRYRSGGLIHGGAYFQNFMVYLSGIKLLWTLH